MKRTAQAIAIALLCLFASGCTINKDYVKADKLTFDAIAPEYKAYVEKDVALDSDQKARRLRTLETWRLRISKSR